MQPSQVDSQFSKTTDRTGSLAITGDPAESIRDHLAAVHACIISFEIRPATRADIPLILEFIRGLASYEKLDHEVEATAEKLERTLFPSESPTDTHNRRLVPAAQCILAFVNQVPAGFALYFFNYSTFLAKPGLYLEDLFVKPEFRGQGAGKSLLLHLAKIANARGCGRMEWTVLDWNESAKGFYRSLGAVQLEEWRIFRLTGPALAQYA